MENPTTNILKPDPVNAKLDEKIYTWDKSWVRPYESPLSAYINFCEINALTFADIIGYWGGNQGSSFFFSDVLQCMVNAPRAFEQTVIERLLPDDYRFFPKITGDIRYKYLLHYCPECIKQGYHSVLSQLPTEAVCPIHNIHYINLDKGIPIGRGGNYNFYYENVGKFPLPPEREELDYSLVEERVEQYKNIKSISYVCTSIKDAVMTVSPVYQRNKTLINRIDPDLLNREDFVESVWNYFDRNAEIVNEDMPEAAREECFNGRRISESIRDELKARNAGPDCYLVNLMIMACMYDFIKDVDTYDYPGDFPYLYDRDFDDVPTTLSYIKASYCRAVRGSYMYYDVFDNDFITKPRGGVTVNTIYNGTVYLAGIEGKISRLQIGYESIKPDIKQDLKNYPKVSLKTIISTIIVHDHFWNQSKEYLRDTLLRPKFDFHKEYSNLTPLLYEIDKGSDGCISIYRMAA